MGHNYNRNHPIIELDQPQPQALIQELSQHINQHEINPPNENSYPTIDLTQGDEPVVSEPPIPNEGEFGHRATILVPKVVLLSQLEQYTIIEIVKYSEQMAKLLKNLQEARTNYVENYARMQANISSVQDLFTLLKMTNMICCHNCLRLEFIELEGQFFNRINRNLTLDHFLEQEERQRLLGDRIMDSSELKEVMDRLMSMISEFNTLPHIKNEPEND